MPRNIHIRTDVTSEQDLVEDLIIESLQIHGQDVYYLPRETVQEDRIFGEEIPARYSSAYKIEMYIDNVDGFDGEDIFSKFGVEIRDEATFIVARKRWNSIIGSYDNNINSERPREGDLIYLALTNSMFEISHVEHEQPFYQLSNLPVFKCRANQYVYNDEDFDTDVKAIQDIEKDFAYSYLITLDDNRPAIAGIEVGDMITQSQNGVILTAEVAKYSDSDGIIQAIHMGSSDGNYRLFQEDSNLYVDSASNTFLISSVAEDNRISENEQNDDFEAKSEDIIDFSESNPFGDI